MKVAVSSHDIATDNDPIYLYNASADDEMVIQQNVERGE